MAQRKKQPPKLIAADSVLIDPARAGSVVNYRVWISRGRVFAEICVSDCHRTISWDIGDDWNPGWSASAFAKIERVIATLVAAREALRAGITYNNARKRSKIK